MYPLAVLAVLAALAAPAFAQQAGNTYLTGLLGALNNLNVTGLVSVASLLAKDTNGVALLAQFAQGDKTVFAPNNDAFAKLPQDTSSNATLLEAILSYHVVPGHYNASDIAAADKHTILRTMLTNPAYVNLEGGKGQVLVTERFPGDGNEFTVLNTVNGAVKSTAVYQNLIIHVVNEVFIPPSSLAQVATDRNLTAFTDALKSVNASSLLESKGFTAFIPRGAAFNATIAQLGAQAQNTTFVKAVLDNHIINGATAYSTDLASGKYFSAGGQPFSFMTNASGNFVTSGSSSARIISSDVTAANGVVHVITDVLINSASNPQAAASAASLALIAATSTPIPTASSHPSKNGSTRTQDTLPGNAIVFSALVAVVGGLFGSILVF